ncbi:MAG: UDP-N-acetylmuramate--L-alanine ligase, partial [Desulfobacterota bacterium]|nr:UDP-N-acetylmuramate--L-alanine ligase [Thermodesulfobacteriota bacterium]
IDPTVIIGGKLNTFGSNAKLGQGEFLVAEADESDGSFLKLSPTITVVTNIDTDHLDFYQDIDSLLKAFEEFNNRVPFYGVNVLCLDDPNIQILIPRLKKRHLTYGLNTQADYQARELSFAGLTSKFKILYHGENLGEYILRIPGIHNIQNSLAAVAVARELGLDLNSIKRGLEEFRGVERRFQIQGEIDGITVIDDYGHHPTEIKATLNTTKQVWPNRQLVVIFQPHRFTRTQLLFKEFLTAFYQADHLVITEISPAGEKPIEGINARALYQGIKEHGHKSVVFLSEFEAIITHLLETLKSEEVILTLGAGDVGKIGTELLQRLNIR